MAFHPHAPAPPNLEMTVLWRDDLMISLWVLASWTDSICLLALVGGGGFPHGTEYSWPVSLNTKVLSSIFFFNRGTVPDYTTPTYHLENSNISRNDKCSNWDAGYHQIILFMWKHCLDRQSKGKNRLFLTSVLFPLKLSAQHSSLHSVWVLLL